MKFNKISRKLAAALLTCTMMVSMLGMTAMAENTPVTGAAAGASFTKYLVMDQDANVPNAVFSYTVSPGTAENATETTPEIKAGIGDVTVTDTVFEAGDPTYAAVENGDTVTLAAGQKYAKETATVDFSAVNFTEPGIYRYVITENGTNDGVTNDTDNTIQLDVYVVSDADGVLSINGYVFPDGDDNDADEDTAKVDGFVNTYDTTNITLEKLVTGNQGNRNQYFSFNVVIDDAVPGTVYTVSGGKSTNPTVLTADTNGTVTGTFELKDGDMLTIKGLTDATTYTITEDDYSSQGYTTKWDDAASTVYDTDEAAEGLTTGKLTVEAAQNVTFENAKEVVTPTGIVMSIAPYILMVVFAGVFAVMFLRKRREY